MLLHAAFKDHFTHAFLGGQGTGAWHSWVEPKPAAHLNYFGVPMLVIPFPTHFHILRFGFILEPATI